MKSLLLATSCLFCLLASGHVQARTAPTGIARSVTSFGAVCNGVTDDKAALTAALGSGGAVYVPGGATCFSSGPIQVTANSLELFGGGSETAALLFGGTEGGIAWTGGHGRQPLISGYGNGVSIHNLAIETAGNGGGVAVALTCTAQPWVRLHDLNIQGRIQTTNYWTKGILLTDCVNDFIAQNWIWGANERNRETVALEITGKGGDIHHVSHNTVQGWDTCVRVLSTGKEWIEGVHFDNNNITGCNTAIDIDETSTGGHPAGMFIRGNEFNCFAASALTPACIRLKSVSEFFIDDNIAYQTTHANDLIRIENSPNGNVNANFLSGEGGGVPANLIDIVGSNSVNTIGNIFQTATTGVSYDGNSSYGSAIGNAVSSGVGTKVKTAGANAVIDGSAGNVLAIMPSPLNGGGRTILLGGAQFGIRTIATGTSDKAQGSDYTIEWHSPSIGVKAETLPPCSPGSKGQTIIVKDGFGNAAKYRIALLADSGSRIDGASFKTISANYGSAKLQCDGTNWMNE